MEHRWPLYDELVQMVRATEEASKPGSWLETGSTCAGDSAVRARVKEQLLNFKVKEVSLLVRELSLFGKIRDDKVSLTSAALFWEAFWEA